MANQGQPRTLKANDLTFGLPRVFTFALKPSANHTPFWDCGYDGPTSNRMRKHGLLSLFCSVLSWDGMRWGVCEWEDPRVLILGTTVETKSWGKRMWQGFCCVQTTPCAMSTLEWKWKLFSMMPHPYCRSSFIIHHAMCLSSCGVRTHMQGWGFPLVHLSSFISIVILYL